VLEHATRMRDEGIAYAEISFNPHLHSGTAWVEGIIAGRRLASRRYGVEIAWLVELSRQASLAGNRAAVDLALRTEGVVGLGLVGDESISAAPLAPLFAEAHAHGLGVMPHAGQGGGPEVIREALDVLHADRIAHGISAVNDPPLLEVLAGRGLCLCVAPSSNRRAGFRADFAELARAAIPLTANSDDPALVGTTLVQEVDLLASLTGRSSKELDATAWAHRFSRAPR
jgi:adenosine deaminase